MSDWVKVVIIVAFLIFSALASYVLVSMLSPILPIIVGLLIIYGMLRVAAYTVRKHPEVAALFAARPIVAVAVIVFGIVLSFVIAYMLSDFIKVIAWIISTWFLFKFLLYVFAENLYREVDEALYGGG